LYLPYMFASQINCEFGLNGRQKDTDIQTGNILRNIYVKQDDAK